MKTRVQMLVIHIGNVSHCPPVLSLLFVLDSLCITTCLLTTKSNYASNAHFKHVVFDIIDYDYERNPNPLYKFAKLTWLRRIIDYKIKYYENSIIWIADSVTLKHIWTHSLNNRKYVLHLMELSENLRLYRSIPLGKNCKKIGNSAAMVVVPEYNRAHIIKAIWELDKLPIVLPNKPYYNIEFKKNDYIPNKYARRIISMLDGKIILLYQGILNSERSLSKIITACAELGEEYVFLIMGRGEEYVVHHSNCYYIPYIPAPYHLSVTSHATIGVLSYVPTKNEYSKLNTLYCAPNKVFEYGMFAIPMIGNDIPGLRYLFDTTGCGKYFDLDDVHSIKSAIKDVLESYDSMSYCSELHYRNTDNVKIMQKIIELLGIRASES